MTHQVNLIRILIGISVGLTAGLSQARAVNSQCLLVSNLGVAFAHQKDDRRGIVAVMNKDKIEQIGTTEQVYHQPETPFVSGFLGTVNLFHGRIDNGYVYFNRAVRASRSTALSTRPDGASQLWSTSGPHARTRIRASGSSSFAMIVRHVNVAGPRARIELTSASGEPVPVELEHDRLRTLDLQPGTVYLRPATNRSLFIRVAKSAARLDGGHLK
jgi:sulfate transport system ATP-binding protein